MHRSLSRIFSVIIAGVFVMFLTVGCFAFFSGLTIVYPPVFGLIYVLLYPEWGFKASRVLNGPTLILLFLAGRYLTRKMPGRTWVDGAGVGFFLFLLSRYSPILIIANIYKYDISLRIALEAFIFMIVPCLIGGLGAFCGSRQNRAGINMSKKP